MTVAEAASGEQLKADILVRNFRALYRIDLALAQTLDNLPDDPRLELLPARNGQATARVRLEDGREIFLHSRYDPAAEAKTFVDRLDLDKNFVFFVSGFGLGYQVREILDRTSDQTVVIVLEPQASVIRAALGNLDFADAIKRGRLVLIERLDKALLHKRLTCHSATMTLGTELAALTYTKQWQAEFHTQMRSFIADYMAFARMAFVTLIGNSRITQENVVNNLWAYHGCPSTDTLKGRFAGYPAIIVSAGPSLAKNIDLLKEAKGKAVIIAVQTTLKTLLKLGVPPDFVVSLDYHELSCRFFEGIEDFSDIHLVAEPKVNWKVPDVFRGKISLLKNDFAEQCLGPAARKRIGITAGSTVAHLAFYLAEFIGADPVILIGQDLAFGGNMYYSPGNAMHDMWSVELNRFSTIEMKEWERIVRHRSILRKVQDQDGREIYTDEQMFTYLQQFERDFAQTRTTVIDATEGGAKKLGAEPMTLREAIDRHCTRPIDPQRFNYLKDQTWYEPQRLAEAAEQLGKRLEEVDEFRKLSEETVGLLKQLEGLLDRPEEFNRRIVKIDQIRSKVSMHHRILRMVCDVSALADLRRFRSDRINQASREQGAERARRQLQRDVEFVEAVVRGCDDLEKVLRDGLSRIEAKQAEGAADDGGK
ncbi:MAG: motility associated factor glycosyltransferase family protein [Phycisphaerae bacterium]|nr:motility associated factor glycosyltransferase family protein [Phycisphaerae bacterium]